MGQRRYIPALLVALIGVLLSLATFQVIRNQDHQSSQDSITQAAIEQISAVEKSIVAELTLLRSIVGFINGSSDVSRAEFRLFLKTILTGNKSFQAMEWIPRIPHEQRDAYARRARKDGFINFMIKERKPSGKMAAADIREEYFPVYYVEPYQGNEGALGFDLASNPVRLAALEQARDTGEVVASASINLVQLKKDNTGILVFAPVYTPGLPHDTVEQRRQNLTGFALGVIRVSALISAFRENTDSQPLQHSAELDLYVFDAQVEEKKQLLYIYNAPHRATKAPRLSLEEAHNDFHVDHNMVIGGRTWKIMARPVASIDEVSPQALLSLFLTLTITAMLTGYMISTVRRAEKIENLVDQRTMELSDASQKAQDREERIRIILETVVDGIITIDEYGTIETFNPAAEHIFLYRGNEVIGQNIKCLMPEPYQTEHDGHLAKYRQTGQTHIIGICRELTGLRKDRSTFPLELTVSEMYVSGQRMFTGVVRDITERKETDRMKEEFISTVSHELRTPLTSIKGSLGLIKSGITGELPAKLDAMLDIAHNNCDRLVRLINDILDMEKITAGKMEFKMSSINMQALLEQAISANQAYADKFNVSFALGDCPENALINGDRDRLMQVLANLLSNAAKFSPEGGLVDIVSIKTEDGFRVEVIDHGSGIPKKFHNQLFKRFSQADSSDNRSKDGTGLGLSISQAIIEHHRGLIGFTSEEGLGSTFYFELPEWNHVQPARIVTPKPQSGHRVLICEDEPDIAALLRLMLEKERYITHIANNAHEARELLQQYTFDAMTLDIGLPDDDGIDLIREIRAEDRTRHLPIIVVSANAVSGETRLNGDAFGIIDWMEKPIDQQRLSEDLRRAVHLSHNGKPRILHLEDDPDVLEIVAHLVEEVGSVTPAKDLNEARHLLQNELFDLVILDLMLPDGDGESILPLLKQPNGTSTPVIVFSAREIHANAIQSIRTVLVKSQTTNQDLLNTIRSAIESVPSASQA